MSVITLDVLVEGMRRDDVLAWLSEFENHLLIMQKTFPECKKSAGTTLELPLQAGFKKRILEYQFQGKDDSHGGRRVLVQTKGKRMEGSLHYSLRTMKPSSNTLITLHMDYGTGSFLGILLKDDIQQQLESHFKKALQEIKSSLENS